MQCQESNSENAVVPLHSYQTKHWPRSLIQRHSHKCSLWATYHQKQSLYSPACQRVAIWGERNRAKKGDQFHKAENTSTSRKKRHQTSNQRHCETKNTSRRKNENVSCFCEWEKSIGLWKLSLTHRDKRLRHERTCNKPQPDRQRQKETMTIAERSQQQNQELWMPS